MTSSNRDSGITSKFILNVDEVRFWDVSVILDQNSLSTVYRECVGYVQVQAKEMLVGLSYLVKFGREA